MQDILFILRNTLQLFLTYCVISQNYNIFTQSETEDSINIMCEPTITQRISFGCKRDSGNHPSVCLFTAASPWPLWAVPAPKQAPKKEKHLE